MENSSKIVNCCTTHFDAFIVNQDKRQKDDK